MKIFYQAFLCLLLLSLSACFELRQEVWILPNGQGRAKIDFGMEKKLVSLIESSSKAKEGKPSPFSPAELKRTEKTFKKNPDVVTAKATTFTEGDLQYLSIDYTAKDFSKLYQIDQNKMEDANITDGAVFTKISDTEFEMIYSLQNTNTSTDFKMTKEDKATMQAMFGEHQITLTFHAPKILKTNGKKVDDQTVSFEIPFAKLNEQKKGLEWKVRFSIVP